MSCLIVILAPILTAVSTPQVRSRNRILLKDNPMDGLTVFGERR